MSDTADSSYSLMPPSMKLVAYTGMPSDNSTYLSCFKNCPVVKPQMDGSTMGLLMILSTLQFNTSMVPPAYSSAAQQAGHAAYVQSGGQSTQDNLTGKASAEGMNVLHSLGITDTEAGIVGGGLKIVRDKQVNVNGPKIYFIKTHITVGQDNANLGLGINF
ncbi:unnamed protein product [Sphagnum balticum]